MWAAKSAAGTVCGSRHATGGSEGCGSRATAAFDVTSAFDSVSIRSPIPLSVCGDGFLLEHELRIAERAHFRNVEPRQLRLRGHALTPHGVDNHVDRETEREDEPDERGHANQLRHQLPGIAIKEPGDRSTDRAP